MSRTLKPLKVSISVSIMLVVVKVAASLITHSMALLASALDSALDVGSSFVNLIAAREAAKPPDKEHAYGHEKIESLAALFQSLFIMVSASFLVFESLRRMLDHTELVAAPVGMGVMVYSLMVTFFLTRYLKKKAASVQSRILEVEELHFSVDLLSGAGILLALALVQWTGMVFWDLLLSILVGAFIFYSTWKILRRAVDELLDRSLEPVTREEIEQIIHSHHPKIVGVHDFRSRQVGGKIFLDFHIEIRGEKDFEKAHHITESLVQQLKKKYRKADVTIHYDPEGAM